MLLPPSFIQIWVSSGQEKHGRVEEIQASLLLPHANSIEKLSGIKSPGLALSSDLYPKQCRRKQHESSIMRRGPDAMDLPGEWGALGVWPGSYVGSSKHP